MKITAFEVRPDEKPYFEELRQKGIEITERPDRLTLDVISELEPDSAVSILGQSLCDEAIFQALARQTIFYLSTRTIGYNHLDLTAAKKYGVHTANVSYAPDGVADYTIMMILLCLRGYKQALWRMQVNDFSLDGLMGRELRDLTVGVIGTGRIGSQVIRDLSGFGSHILAYDPHPKAGIAAEFVPLERLYAESDIITLHTALTPENYHMINSDTIALMKDGVVLINCARGGLMDMKALIEGIESCKIGALGLDTVEDEEGIVHKDRKTDIFADRDLAYLKQFKNVVYTQHMAFFTEQAVRSMVSCGVMSLLNMAAHTQIPQQLS
ncbi:D-isomer specific 2-hydroxyacid dehydrogenase family protein [Anaerolactibacter massiliensis]|uniref:D-isomer specific 2-hydroxyacid dehydrogenase family protein n=1 Tax=Anaerolactibacter massiliensis TaxID=2044573 RepID=UPI000CFA39F6|nr:D-isomer specific 2-hydroxyacid dehydrogenase family protein [Anaerolactibacter massiliensis]